MKKNNKEVTQKSHKEELGYIKTEHLRPEVAKKLNSVRN